MLNTFNLNGHMIIAAALSKAQTNFNASLYFLYQLFGLYVITIIFCHIRQIAKRRKMFSSSSPISHCTLDFHFHDCRTSPFHTLRFIAGDALLTLSAPNCFVSSADSAYIFSFYVTMDAYTHLI